MKNIPIDPSDTKLVDLLNLASESDLVLTRQGVAVGVLVALNDDDDRFDYWLESDPRFAKQIAAARAESASGKKRSWHDAK